MPTRLRGHGWRPCVWLCKGQCCRHCHKTYKQKLGFMYGLMVVVERLGHVGISTHTAGKSNTKEDLPQKFLLPQKVQHNLTDLINDKWISLVPQRVIFPNFPSKSSDI